MKRNLILAALLGLSANAVIASEWAFDNAYWKRAESVRNQSLAVHAEARGKYDQVDRYNP